MKPETPFQPAEDVTVSIEPGLKSLEGPELTRDIQSLQFRTYPPLTVKAYRNYDASTTRVLDIEFSNDLKDAFLNSSSIKIQPAIETKHSINGSRLRISGNFSIFRRYKVTLSADVADIYGQKLGATKPLFFEFKKAQNGFIQGQPELVVLPSGSRPLFPLLSKGLRNVFVTIYGASAEDYPAYHNSINIHNYFDRRLPDATKINALLSSFDLLGTQRISIHDDGQNLAATNINLSRYFVDSRSNLILKVQKTPDDKDPRFVWVQYTNIGLDAVSDGETVKVFVSNLSEGKPIAEALVSSSDYKYSAITNEFGIASLPCTENPQSILCRYLSEEAFLPAKNLARQMSEELLRWYAVSDRNPYRPGETAYVKGFLRKFTAGPKRRLMLPQDSIDEVEYTAEDSIGNRLVKSTCKIDRFGGFTFAIPLRLSMSLGAVKIKLLARKNGRVLTLPSDKKNTLSFMVEEFRRPEFEVLLNSSAGKALVVGEQTDICAQAKYFSGGPISAAQVKWRVTTSSTTYSPPGWKDYCFGEKLAHFSWFSPQETDKNAIEKEYSAS
ncbi:MAG: hypothetical protein K2X81_10460, partial [Candidatus Obscuribacterales bacterium]|nr:hypothetical protein [Candidatus Obscuribacterales bacterium]